VYQILESGGNHTYCTISSVFKDGKNQPWEMFMNSSGDHAELYAVIGRLASRIMRKTGDSSGVIKELKSIGGENGYFTQQYGYVKSKAQHIGFILEEYINSLNGDVQVIKASTGEKCPECGGDIKRLGGCNSCTDCGYSKCG
jgi:ribonucleoside-diphosphate reductase alpha chain